MAEALTSELGEQIVSERRKDRHYFVQWGPAFASKFISYATQASDKVGATMMLDAIVSEWVGTHCKEIGYLCADIRTVWPSGRMN